MFVGVGVGIVSICPEDQKHIDELVDGKRVSITFVTTLPHDIIRQHLSE